ncbi:hypothetical protein MNBD_GAMMA07-1889 [hydrothermal vent metagenome]|uniref:Uncharacterized protein n=1 Tax=hydrothermal vent metagenome TaxID=652676 RepID=A0A3B0XG85_9ZZZZ
MITEDQFEQHNIDWFKTVDTYREVFSGGECAKRCFDMTSSDLYEER